MKKLKASELWGVNEPEIKYVCCQCGSQLYPETRTFNGLQMFSICYCKNPACPNYSLLQIPMERMEK